MIQTLFIQGYLTVIWVHLSYYKNTTIRRCELNVFVSYFVFFCVWIWLHKTPAIAVNVSFGFSGESLNLR